MFSRSIFSSEDFFTDNFFNNSQNFIPNVDQKLRIYFKKKCNKYINIHFPQDLDNEETNQINNENIFPTINNSIIDNIISPCSFNFKEEVINDINSSSLDIFLNILND